eukprot:Clim_evm7s25 gene=Clim_evmTU7s25
MSGQGGALPTRNDPAGGQQHYEQLDIDDKEHGSNGVRVATAAKQKEPTIQLGNVLVPIKYLSLVTLAVQNTLLVLFMKWSTVHPSPEGKYMSSTAVVMIETLKMLTCLYLVYREEDHDWSRFVSTLKHEIVEKPSETAKMSVPSALYTLQNNLMFVAVNNLDAATYQVTYQLKVLTTALFSVVMLGKALSQYQWLSLVALALGVAMVQLSGQDAKINDDLSADTNPFTGLVAVIVACFSSGFAGVYFEKILKGSRTSVWVRNIQLGFFGALTGLFGVMFADYNDVTTKGFFFGYTVWTWATIVTQACGGLIVAVVVKYADNILKGFATSIAIILSCMASVFLFDFHITMMFIWGTMAVCGAVYVYSVYPPGK